MSGFDIDRIECSGAFGTMDIPPPPRRDVWIDFSDAVRVVGFDCDDNAVDIAGPRVVFSELPDKVVRLRWAPRGGR